MPSFALSENWHLREQSGREMFLARLASMSAPKLLLRCRIGRTFRLDRNDTCRDVEVHATDKQVRKNDRLKYGR